MFLQQESVLERPRARDVGPARPVPRPKRARLSIRLRSDKWSAMCAAANLHSESEVASVLGVSRQHVWRIHSGERTPGPDFIAAVLMAFPGVRFEHIFEPTGAPRESLPE